MSFIKELDVVSIFANLIDNAFESCELSKEKKMYLSINIFNESYLAIRMDNSSANRRIYILRRQRNRG